LYFSLSSPKTTDNSDIINGEAVMKNRSSYLLLIVLCFAMLAFWGCPKKTEVASAPEEQKTDQAAAEQRSREEAAKERARQEKAREEQAREEEARERSAAAAASKGLQPVYFDFDKAFIRQDARATMKANADWLKAHPKVKIRIEGNCDERGTIEYNQALGQRRAASAKKFFTDLGIPGSRISLISYGKEKQVCAESTEECWQKNRRDDFIAE
jgi:peptidoglycan-associated lipoprotein